MGNRVEPVTGGDEKALAAALRAGDRAALERLYRRHAELVYRVALRLVGDRDDALDVLQETFLSAWRAAPGFRGESGLATWLVRIALNHGFRVLRRRGRQVPLEQAAALPAAGAGADPVGAAARAEWRAALERAMAELPPGWQAALVLREVARMSYEEMAAAMGTPMGTVRSRLFRARAALRAKLGGAWREERGS
jgi:RNA polymerase sigma-70 factor (ECF subfamily)